MIETALEFADGLRRFGVRISTAELVDALRALQAVGIEDAQAVRLALRATLVKKREHLERFDALFERYVTGAGQRAADGAPDDLGARLLESGEPADWAWFVGERLADASREMTPIEQMMLGVVRPDLSWLIDETVAGAGDAWGGLRSPIQIGARAYRIAAALGVDAAEARALEVVRALAGAVPAGVLAETEDAVRANAGRIRAAIRAQVEAEQSQREPSEDERLESLADRPLIGLSRREMDEVRAEVLRLGRLLRDRPRRRPARGRGRLDLRRTVRRSLSTGGVPVELHVQRRRRRKPRLMVLCDVSDSVRHVSELLLVFVYSLVEVWDAAFAFAFVSELGELTPLFRDHDVERAIAMVNAGAAVNLFANSNYGRVFERFEARYGGRVSSRTTLVVIGDGRGNYHPARADILEQLSRRARRVLWLTPEGAFSWSFGDCAMHEYRVHCDRVAVVRDLRSLRAAMTLLLEDA